MWLSDIIVSLQHRPSELSQVNNSAGCRGTLASNEFYNSPAEFYILKNSLFPNFPQIFPNFSFSYCKVEDSVPLTSVVPIGFYCGRITGYLARRGNFTSDHLKNLSWDFPAVRVKELQWWLRAFGAALMFSSNFSPK